MRILIELDVDKLYYCSACKHKYVLIMVNGDVEQVMGYPLNECPNCKGKLRIKKG